MKSWAPTDRCTTGAPAVHLLPFPTRQHPDLEESSIMQDYIIVAEAAKIAGVGKSTIRRAIKKGDLFASMIEGPNGEQFSVSISSFEAWMEKRGGAPTVHQWSTSGALSTEIGPMVQQQESNPPWEAYIKSQETVQKALDALERAQDRIMEQGSKLMNLQSEMSSQKLLLTSNSESLLEREAKLNELSEQAKEAHQRVEELEEHKAAEVRRHSQERKALLSKLESAEELAAKYEKMPSWVKKMFSA